VRDTLLWQRLPWKRLQPQPIQPSATQIALLTELISLPQSPRTIPAALLPALQPFLIDASMCKYNSTCTPNDAKGCIQLSMQAFQVCLEAAEPRLVQTGGSTLY
jgi:hypothetical protein